MDRIAGCLAEIAAVFVLIAAGSGVQAQAVAGGQAMNGHMAMTALRPEQPGDQARADAVVAAAKRVAKRYVDYRDALADGYRIFMPNQPQHVYHFVLDSAEEDSNVRFDPSKPPALLYEKTGGDKPGYKLVGVMYTDRFGASEADLNERIPLSIAQWHEHLNMCVPPDARQRHWLTGDARFGLSGSITTEAACDAAGGHFMPHLSGWMVHVYPFETDPKKIWAPGMDDARGEDETMPGMKM